MATVVSGAKVPPRPAPASGAGPQNVACVALREISMTANPSPAAKQTSPVKRIHFVSSRSDRRPATGATTVDTRAIGTKVRPAFKAEKPSTDCKKIVIGRKKPIKPKATTALIQIEILKLRLLKSESGTSGSVWNRS